MRQALSPFSKLLNKKARTFSNLFYEARITLTPKLYKDNTRNCKKKKKKKNYRAISQMNTDAKILNKILASQIKQYIKNITHHDLLRFILVVQGWFNVYKSINEDTTLT